MCLKARRPELNGVIVVHDGAWTDYFVLTKTTSIYLFSFIETPLPWTQEKTLCNTANWPKLLIQIFAWTLTQFVCMTEFLCWPSHLKHVYLTSRESQNQEKDISKLNPCNIFDIVSFVQHWHMSIFHTTKIDQKKSNRLLRIFQGQRCLQLTRTSPRVLESHVAAVSFHKEKSSEEAKLMGLPCMGLP